MNLAWIAAVLRPRDVAPHPNFTDDGYAVDPAAQLGAIVIGGDWARQAERVDLRDDALLYAKKSLHFETIREGAEGLIRLAFAKDSSDLARSTALVLMACSATAEMEDYETCDSVLTAALSRVGGSASDRLLRAALLQQRGLRRRDAGKSYIEDVFQAAGLLEELEVDDLPAFRLSPGVSESAHGSLAKMVYSMKEAAWSLAPMEYDQQLPFKSFPSYMDRVKKPASDRLLRVSNERASVYSRYVGASFNRLFEGGHTIVIGGSAPDLFHQALAVELLGHANVYGARKDLALLRLVQHAEGSGFANIQDTLRLLRHAGATKELGLTLEKFRVAGPLSALSWDARQILLRRAKHSLLRVPELMVLRASAELMATTEAEQALEAVLASLTAGGPPDTPGSRQHVTLRKGTAWQAAVALSNASGRGDTIADLLLTEVESPQPYDDLLDQHVAKAVAGLSWKYVSAQCKEAWVGWLDRAESRQYSNTVEAVSIALGRPVERISPFDGLNDIAVRLNSSLSEGGTPLSSEEVARASSIVHESLRETRESAARHSFSLGARSAADIAALLISEYAEAQDLWNILAPFLTDSLVSRMDRSPALERLARERPNMPERIRDLFRSKVDDLLTATDNSIPWDRVIAPYPAALRFAISYHLLGDSSILSHLAELSGSRDLEARREASRTLASVASQSSQDWILPFALQMSHESDTAIKANAARALARISVSTGELSGSAVRRLVELLQCEDGLLVPLYVLRELSDLADFPPVVLDAVRQLAQEHPSRQVREAATDWSLRSRRSG